LPWDLPELPESQLVERLRNRFEVYLNHEDSDFPFEYLEDDGFRIDRQHAINVEAVDFFREGQDKWRLELALSFRLMGLPRPRQTQASKMVSRIVMMFLDLRAGTVETDL